MMLADAVKYNIRLSFPNKERTDITCNQIVEGSAKFTESLCSQDSLKFGLCESPTFECETVGVGNIKGCVFELWYEIYCDSSIRGAEWKRDIRHYVFPIKKGLFLVDSAERQADMQHRKIVAYGGGSATDWSMPILEIAKANMVSSAYNSDLGKIILAKFNSGNYWERYTYFEQTTMLNTYTFTTSNYTVKITINTLYANNLQTENSLLDFGADTDKRVKAWDDLLLLFRNYLGDKFDNVLIDKVNAIKKPMLRSNLVRLKKGTTVKDVYIPLKDFHNRIYPYMNELTDVQYHSISSIGYEIQTSGQDTLTGTIDLESIMIMNILASGDVDFTYKYKVTKTNKEDFKNLDLQKMADSIAELKGKIARTTPNNDIELLDIRKQFNLLPNDDLMPSENLKPLGIVGTSITKSMYSSLWYQEAYTKPYGAVFCNYKNTSSEDVDKFVYLEGYSAESDEETFKTYDLSGNEIISNSTYTNAQITQIMDVVAESIKGASYVPLKLKCVSIPFVECGDTLEVLTQNNDSITTIVMKRTLSGESYVTDEITSV